MGAPRVGMVVASMGVRLVAEVGLAAPMAVAAGRAAVVDLGLVVYVAVTQAVRKEPAASRAGAAGDADLVMEAAEVVAGLAAVAT